MATEFELYILYTDKRQTNQSGSGRMHIYNKERNGSESCIQAGFASSDVEVSVA